jgi:hypothetical protein
VKKDDDEDDADDAIVAPIWGSSITEVQLLLYIAKWLNSPTFIPQSWAKIGSHAAWVAYACATIGFVYIFSGIFSPSWRDALDLFVTAFACWLLAIFLCRFRRYNFPLRHII